MGACRRRVNNPEKKKKNKQARQNKQEGFASGASHIKINLIPVTYNAADSLKLNTLLKTLSLVLIYFFCTM